MDSPLKAAVNLEVLRRFRASSSVQITKRHIHLQIVSDIAQFLQVPFSQQEEEEEEEEEQITLSPDVQKWMDDAWKDIQICFKLTSKEITARENVEGKNKVSVLDLVKYLDVLVKRNTIQGKCNDRRNECILRNRNINAFLAVDGFSGIFPQDFKNYIGNLQYPMTDHIQAVRRMYRSFQGDATTGTDAACLIFIALFKVYLKFSENILDNAARHVTDRVRQNTVMFLEKQAQYYTDIKNLLLESDRLGKIYIDSLEDKSKLENWAVDRMMKLVKIAPKLFPY